MAKNQRGLGRGFESLIPTDVFDESFDPTTGLDESISQLRELPIDKVAPDPDQPRRHFDETALAELAQSVAEHGVVQPIIVTHRDGRYVIVAGERRYRASQLAGLQTIPALVRTLTDQNRLEVSLIENLQRRDLNAVETATAYAKLRDQFNLSYEQIGQRVHKSQSAVQNTMRLLKLPKIALDAIVSGQLTEGQARPLIAWDEPFVAELIPKIIDEQWSARKIEQYIVHAKQSKGVAGDSGRPQPHHDQQVAQLRQRFSTDVAIRVNHKGAGSIVLKFADQADFERLQKLLGE